MIVRRIYARSQAALGAIACCGLVVLAGSGPASQAQPAAQPLALEVVAPAMDCSAMPSADVTGEVGAATKVESAAMVDDGKTAAYCSVKVAVDDYAHFELHLPVAAWTQRLLFGGGPGAQTGSPMKLDQFATVSWQDLGHRQEEDFFADKPAYHINAGYRGMHLQVLAAKALLQKYYGRKQRYSYYNACSNPGREGMIEVQRFPEDFDGVAAGCPPINTTLNNGLWHAWNVLTNTGTGNSAILTADKLPILHQAVLARCDAIDGVKDGIVSEPFACRPPLAEVECKPGEDQATCLTAAQVHVAAELYRGPHDAQGAKLAPSGVLPGSELAWTATIVPSGGRFGGPDEARKVTQQAIRSHYSLPALPRDWTLDQVKFDRATLAATTKLRTLHDGTSTDLSGYAKAGHKLILWQNLGDTNVLPTQAILFYEGLKQQMGAAAVDTFTRFYVLPGAYHCGGGDGPIITDVLLPLMLWVERGVAPEALAGAHVVRAPGGPGAPRPAGPPPAPDLTRPIYPYPYIAKYVGTGDIRSAASYVKGPARPAPTNLSDWVGANFYKPDALQWCTATQTGLNCRNSR